jgi:hypothetical protein
MGEFEARVAKDFAISKGSLIVVFRITEMFV